MENNKDIFPLIARQTGFYKELSMRNVKWALKQFKDGNLEEDLYLAITQFNCMMDDAASNALKETMNDSGYN